MAATKEGPKQGPHFGLPFGLSSRCRAATKYSPSLCRKLSLFANWRTAANANETGIIFSFRQFHCKFDSDSMKFPVLQQHGYSHFVVGVNDKSSVSVLLHRLCEGFQKGLTADNIVIVLHSDKEVVRKRQITAEQILNQLNISVNIWHGVFTANSKMIESMRVLKLMNITSNDQYVYHTDLDEIPNSSELERALAELDSGRCDAIRGKWVDRVASDGQLNKINIKLNTSLSQQFPLICRISEQLMPRRVTWKIVVYRANLRLVSGQHDVWCNGVGIRELKHPELSSNLTRKCREHINLRYDKTSSADHIESLLPTLERPPVLCSNTVMLNHFKYIQGVRNEMAQRAKRYKSMGLPWWTQSASVVKLIDQNNGAINVTDSIFHCHHSGD